MPGTCVVGLQWGDEAKGKIVDLLSDSHDAVVRYNGGANAGHTIVWGDRTFKLSLLPTGILKPHLLSVIGNGVVIHPPRLLEEIRQLEAGGISVGDNLAISHHAHVIFPYHVEEERASESGSSSAIGTTGRGIGPCYQDKAGRSCAIRLGDLYHPEYLRQRLETIVPRKNRIISALGEGALEAPKAFEVEALIEQYRGYAELLKPYVCDTVYLLHDQLKAGKKLLFEAAQGSLLDVDHGSYPYVTSSNTLPASIWSGSGVPARQIDRVIGIVKAYTSRVGRGAFPTELTDALGEHIRKTGREYGTVTGRPRRVGWLDSVALRYTTMLAGADEIAIMLLDVLTGIPELKICTAYKFDGELTKNFPGDSFLLERCEPVFESLPGWSEDLTKIRRWTDLPLNARHYVERIGELLEKKIGFVSVGPDRQQTLSP